MNKNLFLPKKIKVGYQKRNDTFTKKLAYVIYYDNDGVLRKEKSWESWRDNKISSDDFDNTPMEGFVLNKPMGGKGGGWDARQAYIRVYDPRGFEFEITLENLLFILEHNSCIKGKGLEGEYVYVWNHTELFLMPTKADIYSEILEYNDNLEKAVEIKGIDLQPGYTYLSKNNEQYVFLEKHEKLDYDNQSSGQYYWFAKLYNNGTSFYIERIKNIKGKFIKVFSDILPRNFTNMDTELKKTSGYKANKLNYTYEELDVDLTEIEKRIKNCKSYKDGVYVFFEKKYQYISYVHTYDSGIRGYKYLYHLSYKYKEYENLDIFKDCKFYIRKYKK